MDELIAFLNARLDDDELAARAATEGPWHWAHTLGKAKLTLQGERGATVVPSALADVYPSKYDAEHIVRHDPARVLADVAAKRAIVEMHYIIERKVTWVDADGDEWQNHQPVCVVCVEKYSMVDVPADLGPCRTVRLLASVYADHPDFRKEWRP